MEGMQFTVSSVQWCLECTVVSRVYSGVTSVQWCLECTVVSRVYSGASSVRWCLECTVVSRVYSGVTISSPDCTLHTASNHVIMEWWSLACYTPMELM